MVQLFIYHLYDLSQFIVADFNGNDKLELMDSIHKMRLTFNKIIISKVLYDVVDFYQYTIQ
jgi:hypothetical protein